MTGQVGRPRGQPHTGGRRPGTKNSPPISDKVKGDLLACYAKLGGRKFLLSYLKDHPDEMLKCLMRFVPVPREEPVVEVNISAQAAQLTDVEAATRIAFALAKATQGIDTPPTRVLTAEPEPPAAEIPVLPPSQEPLPENNPPVGDTYRGSRLEQDRERPRRTTSITKRRDLL